MEDSFCPGSGSIPPFFLPSDQILSTNECPICSTADQTNQIAGPINTRTGNYNYETTDFAIPTLGQPLRFERTYNSLPVTGTVIYDRPLGYGWTHNYDMNLTFPDDPGGEEDTVILKAPHGSRMRFTANPDGTYTPYPGVWAEMTRQGATAPFTHVITAANQTVYTFSEDAQISQSVLEDRFDGYGGMKLAPWRRFIGSALVEWKQPGTRCRGLLLRKIT